MNRSHRARPALAALCAALAGAGLASRDAAADLYRCEQADGSVRFTDDAGSCPRAYAPRGSVQTIEGGGPPPASTANGAPSRAERRAVERQMQQGQAAFWRERKRQSEEALGRTEARMRDIERFVTHCNRGGEVFARDAATGLKRGVSCESVHGEYAALQERAAELRDYVEGGLEEECRKAGCLPGWLR